MLTKKTKQLLSDNLLILLENNDFKDVTIDMICEKTNISRSTFYRHFKDKQELILWELSDHLNTISSLLPESTYLDNYYVFNFTFMKSRKDYLRKLIKLEGQNSFEEFMFDQIVTYLSDRLLAIPTIKTIDTKTQYSLEIFAKGVIHANIKWIKEGFKESPEEMTKILILNMPECLKKYFIKN